MRKASHLTIFCLEDEITLPEPTLIEDQTFSLAYVENMPEDMANETVCIICLESFAEFADYQRFFNHFKPGHGYFLFINVKDEESFLKCVPNQLNSNYISYPLTQTKYDYLVQGAYKNLEQYHHEKDLLNFAKYDVVTGLANRNMFFDFFTSAKPRANYSGKTIAMLMVDIVNYHVLHSTIGHSQTDDILLEFASRTKGLLRPSDLGARLGSEKFGILAPDLNKPTDASRIAEKLLTAMTEPFWVDGEPVSLRINIGIALYPFDETIDCDIERASEMALLEAKHEGVNGFRYFESHMQDFACERLKIDKGLKEALDNDEFELMYQPKVNVMTGEIEGVEALIRWHSPKWGFMSPDRFIPIAEETGLIDDIGQWVINRALRDARDWLAKGIFENKVMSVNVSAMQLIKPDFIEKLGKALNEHQFPHQQLELELTESSLMENRDSGINQLIELKALGLPIAIDDFGTGYSSLNYLRHLPIDTLKIDRSFVSEIGKKTGSEEIIKVIISLCRIFNLKTIAEGVETQEELNFLSALQCDTIQGYYFSKPLALNDIEMMLQKEPFLQTDTQPAITKKPPKAVG